LTSSLMRSLQESAHTGMLVEVKCDGQEKFQDTFRVTLLPVDEWRDDDENRQWLPSFVLARDPAVARIIQSAQRYLRALSDDNAAGFDGYQADEDGVDLQMQALWWALCCDHPLDYINPPPTFTKASQRLRVPSQVLQAGRGTCIDLALLLAACIEHVDMY